MLDGMAIIWYPHMLDGMAKKPKKTMVKSLLNINQQQINKYHHVILPTCSMYGIFTYKTGWFCLGKCWCAYSSTMEHMGYFCCLKPIDFFWLESPGHIINQLPIQSSCSFSSPYDRWWKPTNIHTRCKKMLYKPDQKKNYKYINHKS